MPATVLVAQSKDVSSSSDPKISISSAETLTASANIQSPSDGATVSDTIDIECYATADGDAMNAYLYIDGSQVDSWSTEGTHYYTWDTTQYSDGSHDIKLEVEEITYWWFWAFVTDTDTDTHTVTVDNDGGGGGSDQTLPWGIERINGRGAAMEVNDDYESSVDVAIVDTGIDYDHEDLQDNVAWGYDEIDDSSSQADWNDDNGHGTHCAGVVAAVNNTYGVVGVAPNIDLYGIKVLDSQGSGTLSDVADGIERAAKGPDGTIDTEDDADVISLSLGASSGGTELQNAIEYAYNYGSVPVCAAGNDGDGDPSTNEVGYPAKYSEAIAVAATNQDDVTTTFSSEGSEVEVAAPGKDIYSTYYQNGYETLDGTSMACPHVAGTVALIIGEDLEDGSRDLGIGTYDSSGTSTIRGILHDTAIDIETSGIDNYSGYGLIDAYAAVTYF